MMRYREKQEKDWVNAEAELFIATQELDKAEQQKSALENQISQKQAEIDEIDKKLKAEKSDKLKAEAIGASIGITTGAVLGSPGGAAGSTVGAGIGLGIGKNAGRFTEEIGDALSSESETDLSLSFKKQRLIKQIMEIQKSIDSLMITINNTLLPKVQKAQKLADIAERAFRECEVKNKS